MKPVFLGFGLLFFLPSFAYGFIPPLPSLIREAVDGRKSSSFELSFRHKMGSALIEERILTDRGKNHFLWRVEGDPRWTAGSFDGKIYKLSNGKTLASRSGAWVRYLTTVSPEQLYNQLLAESFIHSDELRQFQPGYRAEGDPLTWETKDYYLRHPDIFLERLNSSPTSLGTIVVAVVGKNDGSSKNTVDFDRKLRGIRRLEWLEGKDSTSWNFDGFEPSAKMGLYPHHLSFERNGTGLASSELVKVVPLKSREVSDFLSQWRSAGAEDGNTLGDNGETALKLLLSYR